MGYLNIDSGPVADFTQAVISVLFRVPQASIDAAQADWTNHIDDADPLPFLEAGIIPLLSWGPRPPTSFTYVVSNGATATLTGNQQSSCVGVYCGYALEAGNDNLTHNLYTRLQFTNGTTSLYPNNDVPPEMIGAIQSDFFQVGGSPMGSIVGGEGADPSSYQDLVVTPDLWHHALISFSISGATAQFWQALDDVDRAGGYLAPYNTSGNGIKTAHEGYTTQGGNGGGGGPAPCSGLPIGLPAASNRVSYIYRVELAELQFFTGVTLDTSVTSNRRAFIDDNGRPVSPDDSSGSIALLGKHPDIALIGSQNWIAGTNTGSTGGASGVSFTPVGTINPYTPNAALGS